MKENTFFTVLMDVLLLIVFISLTGMAINLSGAAEVKHLGIVFVLLLFSVFALLGVYRGEQNSWLVLSVILLVALIEVFSIYYTRKIHFLLYVIILGVNLLAFGISILMLSAGKNEEDEALEQDIPSFPAEEDDEITVEEVVPDHSVVYKENNSPGKFVASKTGTTYHAPKCDWAKRIKSNNMVWFVSEKDAKKKGYKKHDCLK